MSTATVYKPHPDPWHGSARTDPLGDAMAPGQAPYSISKIAEEAVARYCARAFDLPVTIARMGAAYGEKGGLRWHLTRSPPASRCGRAGNRCPTARSTTTTSPPSSRRSSTRPAVPATIVNWCGDAPVSVQEWSAYLGDCSASRRRSRSGGAGRVDRLRRRPDEAHRRLRPVQGRLAGRVPGWPSSSSAGSDRRVSGPASRTARPSWRPSGGGGGLDDFGPGDFREGLDVLLDSLERDADLSDAGTPR